MLGTIYNTLLVNPIFNALMLLNLITGNLAFAILGLTILIKGLSIPLVAPSLKSVKKQRELQPQLEKIREKFKYDKQKQAEAQMKLMKEHGVNPAAGCYSMIITIIIFTALYSVIRQIINIDDIAVLNSHLYADFLRLNSINDIQTKFLYLDLTKPDPYHILAILLGTMQFLFAKMNIPYSKVGTAAAKKTPDKQDDIAYNMQQQSLYIMPIFMVMLGATMPAGVAIYLIASTLFSIVQNYFVNGFGGLEPLIEKIYGKRKNTTTIK